MNAGIFREYDVRGVFGRDFDLDDALTLGRAYGTYLRDRGGRSAAVGRDCRLSSDDLRTALIQGLVESGVDVVDVGLCPTPTLYFSLYHLQVDGGIMVTASHNPPEYNGFKICLGRENLYGAEIQRLKDMVESGRFVSGSGKSKTYNIIDPYVEYLIQNIKIERPVPIALDAGNGVAGLVAGPLFDRLGLPVQKLFFEPDGRFPNHTPDPTVEKNMTLLSEAVRKNGFELGLGFDGDMDRLGIVDEQGRLIHGDMLLLILARALLEELPGATVVADVKCSRTLFDDIEARGGRAVMWKSGHSLIKVKRKELDAPLAGEMSGHIFYGHRWFGFDDALYAALRLLEIVAKHAEPVSRYLADLPPVYNTPEMRLDCPEDLKFRLVAGVREELARDHKVVDLDGVRVTFPDGWGLVRASNTGPILVTRFEAQTPARLDEIRTMVEQVIERVRKRL